MLTNGTVDRRAGGGAPLKARRGRFPAECQLAGRAADTQNARAGVRCGCASTRPLNTLRLITRAQTRSAGLGSAKADLNSVLAGSAFRPSRRSGLVCLRILRPDAAQHTSQGNVPAIPGHGGPVWRRCAGHHTGPHGSWVCGTSGPGRWGSAPSCVPCVWRRTSAVQTAPACPGSAPPPETRGGLWGIASRHPVACAVRPSSRRFWPGRLLSDRLSGPQSFAHKPATHGRIGRPCPFRHGPYVHHAPPQEAGFQNGLFADPLGLEGIGELLGAHTGHELHTVGYRLLPFPTGGVHIAA